ncbi:hypothetical protein KO361_01220 [Candidatus Woesearchaeota archaeon]|nr:hypothetical protein [Candidatus Woesearchaeota archaeon]
MADILKNHELLVKFGFINSSAKDLYEYNDKKGYYVLKPGVKGVTAYDASHADEELDEDYNISSTGTYQNTGYPSTKKRYRLISESFGMSLEELYFWSIGHLRQDNGFPKMVKVTDVFSASENSAFFGQSAQRLSIQEDRASAFLKGISELVRTLFQIVRELRIIDERLTVYGNRKNSKSADATLKGLFADFAENKGGQAQPGSLFHLSNQVGYAVLPDLFFNTVVHNKDDVDKVVDGLNFNQSVKSVLKRKLYQFLVWVDETEKELITRRRFQIKYLRQHYVTIKTYMSWVKPYLKHIKRLTMNEEQLDSPDLISSFETSSTEIEVIGYKPIKNVNACVLMTFLFNTRPVLNYQQEASRGPVHVGKGTMTLRAYAWTDKQIEMYRRMKDYEDRELLGLVDDQLKSAMDMLGDDLDSYIREAEGTIEEPVVSSGRDKLKPIQSDLNVFDPFISIFKGFGEIGKAFVPNISLGGKSKKGEVSEGDVKGAIKAASGAMWMIFKNYKKAHGMLSW